MGFGLCALGYSLLLFFLVGGDTLGYILLACGFKKLSAVERTFKYAAYGAIALVPVGLMRVVGFINKYISLYPSGGKTEQAIQITLSVIFVTGSLFMHKMCFDAIIKVARKAGSASFARKAKIRQYISFAVFAAYGFAVAESAVFMSAVWIAMFVLIVINTVFLFNCFASITTQSRVDKEKEEE